MELSYQEDSKSSSEEVDRPSEQINDEMGTGRSYECVFCRRGFTTAQALGGHMNIHRKDRANKAKSNFHPSSSAKVDDGNNYTDLGLYSASNPSFLTTGNYYSTLPDQEVDTNYNYYHQLYFPSHACGAKSPSRVQYSEVLCVENRRDPHQFLFGQDWRQRGLSLYTNPLCVHENKDKIENNSEEDDLDLELRLGHHP